MKESMKEIKQKRELIVKETAPLYRSLLKKGLIFEGDVVTITIEDPKERD